MKISTATTSLVLALATSIPTVFAKDKPVVFDDSASSRTGDPFIPGNAECTNAEVVTLGSEIVGSTDGSTIGEDLCFSQSSNSVWYKFIGTGQYIAFDTCTDTNFDTYVEVATGSCGSLACVDWNDDYCGLGSAVGIDTVAGETYYIQLRGYESESGEFTLTVSETPLTSSPTFAPTPEPEPGPNICFSDRSTVQVEHVDEPVAMRDLQVGDRVWTGAKYGYERVYAFAHSHHTWPAQFLQLETTAVVASSSSSNDTSATDTSSSSTSSTHILEISGEHLLFVDGQPGPVRADSVHVGNVLLLGMDMVGNNKLALVTGISHTTRKGVFAPLTTHGTIVVNGILASNYVGVQDKSKAAAHVQVGKVVLPVLQADLIHWWMTPLRLVCTGVPSHRWCGTSPTAANSASHDAKGGNYWAATGIHLVQWGEVQHLIVQVLILLTAVFILGALYMIEQLVWMTLTWTSTQWCLVLFATALVTGYTYNTKKSSKTQISKQKQQ